MFILLDGEGVYMSLLELKSLNRNSHEMGGETMVIELGETEVIIEYTADDKDIRIVDGDTVVKVRLNEDCSIRDVLEDDQFVNP